MSQNILILQSESWEQKQTDSSPGPINYKCHFLEITTYPLSSIDLQGRKTAMLEQHGYVKKKKIPGQIITLQHNISSVWG